MAFDIDMIKAVYERMPARVEAARNIVGKPLTLSEKILYSHLWDGNPFNTIVPWNQNEMAMYSMAEKSWLKIK